MGGKSDTNDFLDHMFGYIDNNLRTIRYCVYTVGAFGLLLVARSLHVHKKFTSVKDIPVEFITKSIPFRGWVKRVDRNHILHVEHIPIVTSKWLLYFSKSREGLLPVRLAGVQVTPLGSQWLAENLLQKEVTVAPLTGGKDDGIIEGILFTRKRFWRFTSINELLIKQGICKVNYPSPLPSSQTYLDLLDMMVALETIADKKAVGMWGKATTGETTPSRSWGIKSMWSWLNKFRKT